MSRANYWPLCCGEHYRQQSEGGGRHCPIHHARGSGNFSAADLERAQVTGPSEMGPDWHADEP
jgi:hypothetical protein